MADHKGLGVEATRQDYAVGLLLVVAALAACGREPASQVGGDAAARAPAASATVPPEKVAGCAGFTGERAAAFLGVPAADVKDASTNLYAELRMCSFSSTQEDGRTLLGFSLRRDASIEEATLEMARLRENVGLAQGVIADTTKPDAKGPAYEEIRGLGEEAIWTQVNGTLNVRKGNVSIQVMSPSDRDAQKRLAEQVVAGLS